MLLLVVVLFLSGPAEVAASAVSCDHVRRLQDADPNSNLSLVLPECWSGASEVDCTNAFGNLTKLTTSLAKDYRSCERDLDEKTRRRVDKKLGDILAIFFAQGNETLDDESLYNCRNRSSHRLSVLCWKYGLSREHRTLGFHRHRYASRFALEESLDELGLTCDRVFSEGVQDETYREPVAAFANCNRRIWIEPPGKRDRFEKEFAVELGAYRAKKSKNSTDFRKYVSCRKLQEFVVNGTTLAPSPIARRSCTRFKQTYSELLNETSYNDQDRYVECRIVFNRDLERFTSELLEDYAWCIRSGQVGKDSENHIRRKFKKLFMIIEDKTRGSHDGTWVADNLVNCAGFNSTLADLCRLRGMTLVQAMLNVGELARVLHDTWLNAEDLSELYLQCDDLFDEWVEYLDDVPLDKFVQCKWVEGTSKAGIEYIESRIKVDYEDKHKWKLPADRGEQMLAGIISGSNEIIEISSRF